MPDPQEVPAPPDTSPPAPPRETGTLPPGLLDDLADEGDVLDALVRDLPAAAWATPTPAAGWTIAHQVAHLAWTDRQAALAATDPAAFLAGARAVADRAATFVDEAARAGAREAPAALYRRWSEGRRALAGVLPDRAPGARLPWFGPPMSVASMVTARLMETWAHTRDVADALGAPHPPTARLHHVARIGVAARAFSFTAHGLEAPAAPVRVELRAPDGGLWTFGPQDAGATGGKVTGDALGFCLLVTQRAHRDDVDVRAEGAQARRWLTLAQAFAGPPGTGRPPRGTLSHHAPPREAR